MRMLNDKRKVSATKSIQNFIKCILNSPTHFNYGIVDEKVVDFAVFNRTTNLSEYRIANLINTHDKPLINSIHNALAHDCRLMSYQITRSN